MATNPYVDAATGTHYNKLGIKDRDQLHDVEYNITRVRAQELTAKPIQGNYDLDHLKAIHKHIFQDVYEWAGKPRTLNFSKRDPLEPEWKTVFAPTSRIDDVAAVVKADIEAKGRFKGMEQKEFAHNMADLFSKINYMHPFPEGNGRSSRAMIEQLSREAGYTLKFDRVDSVEWNKASAAALPQQHREIAGRSRPGNPRMLQEVFERIAEPIKEAQRGSEAAQMPSGQPDKAQAYAAVIGKKLDADKLSPAARAVVMDEINKRIGRAAGQGTLPDLKIREQGQQPSRTNDQDKDRER